MNCFEPACLVCVNPDGNSLHKSTQSYLGELQGISCCAGGLHKSPQLQRWLDGYAICGNRTVP